MDCRSIFLRLASGSSLTFWQGEIGGMVGAGFVGDEEEVEDLEFLACSNCFAIASSLDCSSATFSDSGRLIFLYISRAPFAMACASGVTC